MADEHTDKNIISEKGLMNIGIQMFPRKRLADFFLFLSQLTPDSLFRRGRLGAERISRETFDLIFIVYTAFDRSLP